MNNIIYRLVNRRKEKEQKYPCYYVGSKINYSPGKYWGSSKHPVLLNELTNNITDFEMEILCYVNDDENITEIERQWQIKLNAVADKKYYNLRLAGTKFSSRGFGWYYDPKSNQKGYFTKDKVPENWLKGMSAETSARQNAKLNKRTGLKLGSLELHNKISDSISSKQWTLRDPKGNIHIVTKLHKFCKNNNLSEKLLLVKNINRPISRGKSKGWCVIDVKNIRD